MAAADVFPVIDITDAVSFCRDAAVKKQSVAGCSQ